MDVKSFGAVGSGTEQPLTSAEVTNATAASDPLRLTGWNLDEVDGQDTKDWLGIARALK